ncbi:MAG: hypothetical protein K1X52_01995 [Pyrinomonadaceae bacterium]|nr:hypothetical protein [Pyrinomonadaceae bacterium]
MSTQDWLAAARGKAFMIENSDSWLNSYQEVLTDFERKLKQTESYEIDLNALDPDNYEKSLAKAVAIAQGPEYLELNQRLADVIFQLFSEYAVSGQRIRREIERLFDDKSYVLAYLCTFPTYASKQGKKADTMQWLRVGLVAALIENGRSDVRDTWVGLGLLYCMAEVSGLKPFQYFKEIGKLRVSERPSSDLAKSGSSILDEFLNSDYRKSLECREKPKQTNR